MIRAFYYTFSESPSPKLSTDVQISTWIVHAEKLDQEKLFLLLEARSEISQFKAVQ